LWRDEQKQGQNCSGGQSPKISWRTRKRVRKVDWSISFTDLKHLNVHLCDSRFALLGCRPLWLPERFISVAASLLSAIGEPSATRLGRSCR
jgi:hypothetical protein